MSEVTFNSLLFRIAGKLEEINAREHVLFMCHGKIEHRDDETILSKFKKLKEGGFLGVDSLQMLKGILKAEKQWDFLAEIGEFENSRGKYKKLLEKIIGALENHNDLERLTSFIWERYKVPEERRNDVRSLVQVLEEMNVIGVDGLNLFTEPFINLNNDELLAELKDFQNRRTKDEKRGRRAAQAAAVWSFAGAVCRRIIGVLKVHCTLRRVVTGCSVTFGIVQLLRGSSTWQDFLELLGQAFPEETRLLGLSEGSVCFMVQAETSLALEELYERYSTGRLQKDLQKFLVTDDIRQLADGEEVVVLVNIDEKEFREARDDLINVDKEEADHDAQPTQFHEVEGDDLSQTAQETSSGEADGTPLFSQQGDLYPETSMIGKATAGVEEEVLDNQEDTDWLTRTEKARGKMAAQPNANFVADLERASINVNSGSDEMMKSLNMNGSELLTSAPLSIVLLGQLMLVVEEKGFSLENQRPEKGFQFIQHPECFRASLVQVSNSGWRAFNEAHKNMDAIRLYSAEVPDQVKKVLVKGSAKDVEDFLPIALGKIDRNGTECLRLAQAVEAKFENVMDLMGELLEVFSAAGGYYKKKQEEIKIKREIALAKEKAASKKLALAKEQQEKQVKEAKAGWEKAVDGTNSANSFSSSSVESGVKNARFKIAEARGLLERQEDRCGQTCKELKENNEELSKVIQSLAEFSPEKIANFDQIREILKALASVREQWKKLVEFFKFITAGIKVWQKPSISSFVESVKSVQKWVLANVYSRADFMRDLINEQASQANTASYVVWSISNTYVEISRHHLMSKIASLGHLIALDPEKERDAIEAKRNELMEGSQEAEEAIRKYVSEAKDHFREKMAKRVKKSC